MDMRGKESEGGLCGTIRYLRRMSRSPSSGALVLAACLASGSPLAAQWVEPPGQGWVALTTYHQDTRDVYDLQGRKDAFVGAGHVIATASFLTVARGLTRGVDAWAQFSFLRLRFSDLTGESTATGVGDTRFYVRLNPLLLAGVDLPVAVRAGVKLPVGDFDVGSDQLPLGDGQRDWEIMLEGGWSFYPAPFYFMSWAGYRWREARDGGRTDFGNERFFYAALGGTALLDFKFAVEGWYGQTPVFNNVLAVGAERELLRLGPSLLLNVGPGQLEVGARIPLRGRSLPAGEEFVLGYFTRFGG